MRSWDSWVWAKEDLVGKLLIFFHLVETETLRPDPHPASIPARNCRGILFPPEKPSGPWVSTLLYLAWLP